MRFLHVSDLHIGKRVNGISMLEEQRHILAQIAAMGTDKSIDALVVAGDIYDKAAPSAEAVTVLDAFLTEMASRGIRVLAVPGNHDSAERIAYAQGLLANQGVCFPPVFDGDVRRVELHDEHGPVSFWLLPFLKPGDVRRFFPDEEIGDSYSAAVRAVLAACSVDASQRNVIVSHQLVTAGAEGPDRADEEIKLGGIDNVDVSAYADFDYVALGHVHRQQRVGRDTVRYAGSPLKYSLSEVRYDKVAVLVELGAKAAGDAVGACVSFERLPLRPLHDMREVSAPLEELLAQAEDMGEAAQDYLHITLTDAFQQYGAMARIRAAFPNVMTLGYNRTSRDDLPAPEAKAVDPDEVDPVQLFARFYEEQTQSPLDEEQRAIVSRLVAEVLEWHARGEEARDAQGVERKPTARNDGGEEALDAADEQLAAVGNGGAQ